MLSGVIKQIGFPSDVAGRAAVVLLAAVWLWSVYRAASQSITTDEAYTYQLYLERDWRAVFRDYDANNHVLYTLLTRLVIPRLGRSEFALRFVSISFGALFFVAVYQLCRLLFRASWLFLPSVITVAYNPYVLDFVCAARGYGPGVALVLAGLYALLRYGQDGSCRWLGGAGWSFGLAIGMNLTMVFPVAAAQLVFGIHWWRDGREFLHRTVLPCLAVAFVINALPLSHAQRDNFYVGARTLAGTVETLSTFSLRHHLTPLEELQNRAVDLALWLVPSWTAAAVGLVLWRGGWAHRLLACTWLVLLMFIVSAHIGLQLPYPEFRTGLYLIPLTTLVLLCGVEAGVHPFLRAVLAAPQVVVGLLFVAQLGATTFAEWPFDAGTRRVAERLEMLGPCLRRGRSERLRLGCSWVLDKSLSYYRSRRRMEWIAPITRASVDDDWDIYVLLPEDAGIMEKRNLEVLYEDPVSHVKLAVPRSAAAWRRPSAESEANPGGVAR